MTAWPYSTNDAAKIIARLRTRRPENPRAAAQGFATSFDRHGIEHAYWDEWIAEEMEIARVKHTSVSTQFLEAVARCDYNRATELIGDGQDDFAKTLGAFLDVSVRQDPASAEAKLCTVGQLWDWSIGKCFRDLTLAHVMLAAGEVESAEHRLKMLEEALLSDPAQLGQWRSLIAQARSSFPARVAPPETGDCAPA